MKTIIFPTFFLLSILISTSLHAKYVPLAEGKHETKSEIKEPLSKKQINSGSLSSIETNGEVGQIPTTREMVYLLTQSAKTATDTADKVMKAYENYYSGISTAITITLAIFAVLGGAGFWVYFRPILTLKKEYREILKRARKQQDNITELTNNAKINIAALSAASSANVSITLYMTDNTKTELLEETEELCSRALELNPQDSKILAWIYGMLGIVFGEQNKLPESCEAFKKALENDPDNVRTLCNAACIFAVSDKNEEALEYLQKAIEIRPSMCEWAKTDDMLNKIRNDPKFPCH